MCIIFGEFYDLWSKFYTVTWESAVNVDAVFGVCSSVVPSEVDLVKFLAFLGPCDFTNVVQGIQSWLSSSLQHSWNVSKESVEGGDSSHHGK